MFKRLCAFAACLVLLACAASPARGGVIIFDNTAKPPWEDFGDINVVSEKTAANGWWAAGFTTSGTPVNLNSAKFLMYNTVESTRLRINLYSSIGTVPETFVKTLYDFTPGLIEVHGPGFTVSDLNVPLLANTTYFLAAEVTSGNLYWQFTAKPTGDPPALRAKQPSDNTWVSSLTDAPLQMKLEGTAVPEPCTFALVGVASGCWWCVGRFRRRKKSDVAAC